MFHKSFFLGKVKSSHPKIMTWLDFMTCVTSRYLSLSETKYRTKTIINFDAFYQIVLMKNESIRKSDILTTFKDLLLPFSIDFLKKAWKIVNSGKTNRNRLRQVLNAAGRWQDRFWTDSVYHLGLWIKAVKPLSV